jgi:DNA polymerase I-like protein with 3'-5' exonuclease and polymerase domains
MAQVPAGYSPYGHECRELFIVELHKVLVGADAAALELRVLAGYMARYDGGAYVRTVLDGNKDDGTDIHSVNAKALGLDPKGNYFDGESGRDIAKTWFYAFLYGAGDAKLGFILSRQKGTEAMAVGKNSRTKFMRNLPALASLVKKIKQAVKERGYLVGLDGRQLHIRSQHAAPNALFQNAGAVLMKKALVILDADLQSLGFIPGVHYEFVANVHDEWQIEADIDKGEVIGKAAVEAIRKAGEYYNFRCPLDGEYKLGRNWAETH